MSGRKKILFVVPSMIGGGAERIFVNLMNHISRERFEPILAIGSRRGELLPQLDPTVEIHEIGGERARNAIPGIIKAVTKVRPFAVVSTLGMNFAVGAASPFFPSKTRVVFREGSSPTAFLADVARQSILRAQAYKRLYRLLYGRASLVICQSDFMRDDIHQNMGVDPKKLTRIYNPVDSDSIDSKANEAIDLYANGLPTLIGIGRQSFEKGFDVLLNAFSNVIDLHPKGRLILVGEGDRTPELKKQAADLGISGSVEFIGFQDNPYKYLKRADIFVSPSRYEGFSNVLVEALACGVPAVVTDCPSANREVITEGFNGWFAENENAASLAGAILTAIRERENVRPDGIRQDCLSRFSIEAILPQYERAIEG